LWNSAAALCLTARSWTEQSAWLPEQLQQVGLWWARVLWALSVEEAEQA